ncbi:aldo/keto reductase [Janthinobacterium sp. J1-1]|uniref:aldo/keto reductase n=1 Tax=Janthinobacterium sp. J1-1 TaxID=3065910 RepID=UPI002810B889|nr:aldo/keto reductase [Janthinobacterium sp. J1-1]
MSIYFQPGLERSFGTYPLRGEELASAVRAALATGYRAFDTAQGYGNEADLGLALQDCGVPREQLCITSKVALENFGFIALYRGTHP